MQLNWWDGLWTLVHLFTYYIPATLCKLSWSCILTDCFYCTCILHVSVSGGSSSEVNIASSTSSSPFHLLQLNEKGTNVENIFKAVMYLHDAVHAKSQLESETFVFSQTMYSPAFKEMAMELGAMESSLWGITAQSLHSLYEWMVQECMIWTNISWSQQVIHGLTCY